MREPSWTDLRCKQGRQDEAQPRVSELLNQSPHNPYYILANLFIIMATIAADPDSPDDEIFPLYHALEHAAEHAEDSPDALAKIAFFSTITGFWSNGLAIFLDALFATQDPAHYLYVDELFTEWISDIEVIDGNEDLNEVPIEIAARAACLLLAFNKYLPEARLAMHNLMLNMTS